MQKNTRQVYKPATKNMSTFGLATILHLFAILVMSAYVSSQDQIATTVGYVTVAFYALLSVITTLLSIVAFQETPNPTWLLLKRLLIALIFITGAIFGGYWMIHETEFNYNDVHHTLAGLAILASIFVGLCTGSYMYAARRDREYSIRLSH